LGNPYARFDEGGLVMESMDWLLRHRLTKGAATDRPIAKDAGACPLLYQTYKPIEEVSNSSWKSLNGPDILGDDDFRGQLQGDAGKVPIGIPKRKRLLRHLPLSDIARPDRERSDWMREAYRGHGYTMQEIADFSSLHHSTVSRLINKVGDENARSESPTG